MPAYGQVLGGQLQDLCGACRAGVREDNGAEAMKGTHMLQDGEGRYLSLSFSET